MSIQLSLALFEQGKRLPLYPGTTGFYRRIVRITGISAIYLKQVVNFQLWLRQPVTLLKKQAMEKKDQKIHRHHWLISDQLLQ